MSDPTFLSDFGAGIEEADVQDEASGSFSRKEYRAGRCEAISKSSRRRCRSPVSHMGRSGPQRCANHPDDAWSINDPGEKLVMITGDLDGLTLDDVDQGAVDFDVERVKAALASVGERWDPYS